jgi:glutathione S-transferase
VNWWLHELGVPFAPRPPHDSGNPHPFGQIPALLDFTDVEDETRAEDDAVKLWESGAILAYLADRHGPLDTPARRADAGKWIHWANASLDPCLFQENDRGQVLDTGARVRPGAKPPRALERLEKELARSSIDPRRRGWLARSNSSSDSELDAFGDASFGVSDVAVGAYLLYVPQFFPEVSFARWPNIVKFMKACASRPAYAEAYGEDVANFLVDKCAAWSE